MALLMSKGARRMSTWDMSPQGTKNKPGQSCCFRKPLLQPVMRLPP